MAITLLLALFFLQNQDPQLEQIRREVDQIEGRLESVIDALNKRPDNRTVCSADLRWVGGSEPRRVPASTTALVPLSLFGIVSRPAADCLPAEVRITASYLDSANNLVCAGAIENAAVQTAHTQSVNFEIRPWNLSEFSRWRNQPPSENSGAARLSCINPDGLAEVVSEELSRVNSVIVRVTLLPVRGGSSTAEIRIDLQR
jgi:hypothetical protein